MRPRFLVLALVATGLASLASAQELELRTERVVVFKDGTALVAKSATGVVDEDGSVYTEDVPGSAALGCFWAAVDPAMGERARIGAMRAEYVEEVVPGEGQRAVASMQELLEANRGREVRVRIREADGPELAGRIESVLAGAGLVVLVQDAPGGHGQGSTTVLPIADVRALLGADLVTVRDAEETTRSAKRLTVELRSDDGPYAAGTEVRLNLFYFTPGLRWIPTYRLGGDLETRGALSLQAEIVNELEDLQDTEVALVVGVPNFRFGQVVSPLSLEKTMVNVLHQAAPSLMGVRGDNNVFSNGLFTQRAGEFNGAPVAGQSGGGGELAPELAATGEQDLFVYRAGRLDLKQGARATLPLWEAPVDLEHLYTLDLDLVRGSSQGFETFLRDSSGGTSPLSLTKNPVWHQFRLANEGAYPWTTGPVLLMRNGIPLGQELLTYTPSRGEVMVPVTVAVDVRGSYAESQLAREENAVRRNGHSYDRITKRLELTVTNHRTEPAQTQVSVGLGGDVTRASEGGEVVRGEPQSGDWMQRNLFDHALNPHSDVTWELELAPGETQTLELEFVLYAR